MNTQLVSPQAVGVSAVTGQGVDEFFAAVGEAAEEFERYACATTQMESLLMNKFGKFT